MTRNTSDYPVFYHHTSLGQCVYLIVYVDDIVITGSEQDGILCGYVSEEVCLGYIRGN